jgi:hypothetical protein
MWTGIQKQCHQLRYWEISIVPVTLTVLLYTQYKDWYIVPCPTAWNFFVGPMIEDRTNCITSFLPRLSAYSSS